MTMMHALRAHTRGGPEVLMLEGTPVPAPAADEVLVQVHAAAITFAELDWEESWTTAAGESRTPVTPSHEFSGIVAGVGSDVTSLQVGQPVFGLVPFDRDGAAAEFVVTPARHVARKPQSLSHVEAASLPLAALTAWQALVDHAKVVAGEKVLVLGGAGGVGSLAVQLATTLGARVTATALPDDVAFVQGLGNPQVISAEEIDDHEEGERWDVVLDTIGGDHLQRAFAAVRPHSGRLITLQAPPSQARAEQFHITAAFFIVAADHEELERLSQLADEGHLRPRIAEVFPLGHGRQAYESGRSLSRPPGKVVLEVR
jgi:NADPH:quinone reductase-like Zn-dependent oxidoreductase